MMDKVELMGRVASLQEKMQENECQAMIIIQNVDLYYFSGTMQNAQLYIPAHGEPLLFCRKSCQRALKECPWRIIEVGSFKAIPRHLGDLGIKAPARLALEYDVLPVANFLGVKKIFPHAKTMDGSSWIKSVRAIKSPYEIAMLKNAGQKMAEVFKQVADIIKPGKSEIACAAELEMEARKTLHEGIIRLRGYNQSLFFGHFLSGESGALPSFNDGATGGPGLGAFFPQGCSEKILAPGEPITLDYVGIYNGYQVDQTRTFVIGSLPEQLYKAYNITLEIQDAIINQVKPGIAPSKLWEMAVSIAAKNNLQDHLQGYGSDQAKFVGHGIGLEVDEPPVLARGFDSPLLENMVFALEPKFVFPGLGMVGIENTWLVTAEGAERITVFPDELIQIPG
ncbi:MAG: Xaa-Pro peptidase family protein [Syntrophomonas sp.]